MSNYLVTGTNPDDPPEYDEYDDPEFDIDSDDEADYDDCWEEEDGIPDNDNGGGW